MGKNLKALRQKIRKLKNLKQYKDLPDEELEKIALEQLRKEEKKKEQSLVYTEDEQEIAEQKLKKYQEIYHIEAFGEIEQLKQLVYFEILAERIQRNLNEKREFLDPKEISSLTKTLLEIENNILNIRKSLGILEEKREDSAFEYVQKLKKKFKQWCNESQATRHLICPHCSQQILLKIRTEAWEAQKHPYFKDRILYNEHLLRLYLAGILSSEDIGEILGITKEKDYLEWLMEKWMTRPELKRLKEEAKELRKKKLKEIKGKKV